MVIPVISNPSCICSEFQFRGLEIIELNDVKPASVDDIVRVHSRSYVTGLEKVIFYHLHSLFWI